MVFFSSDAKSPALSFRTFAPLVLALTLLGAAAPAKAQFFGQPQQQAQPAPSADAASMVRIDRLENQVRNLNGQVEQLQFQVKRLEDQLRKFQMDVDQRFLDAAPAPKAAPAARTPAPVAPQKRSELDDPGAMPVAANTAPPTDPDAPPPEAALAASAETVASAPSAVIEPPPAIAAPPTVTVGADGRRHDAFDPGAAPNAPGAPLPLGSADSASKPVVRAASGPLDITSPEQRGAQPVSPEQTAAVATPMPSSDPVKAQYDAAVEQMRGQRYDAAQQAFSAFIAANPHSRLIAPAIFHLGETFSAQGRHPEAAEQFLKIVQDFSRSAVAPDAMIKLGASLMAMGAKEQACAVFVDVPRKYPNATAAQKLAADREAKKAAC